MTDYYTLIHPKYRNYSTQHLVSISRAFICKISKIIAAYMENALWPQFNFSLQVQHPPSQKAKYFVNTVKLSVNRLYIGLDRSYKSGTACYGIIPSLISHDIECNVFNKSCKLALYSTGSKQYS